MSGAVLPSTLLKTVQEETEKAAIAASDRAHRHTTEIGQALLQTIEDKLKEMTTQIDKELARRPVAAIKINDLPEVEVGGYKPEFLDDMIINAKLGLNTMLVGPAGAGKTTASELLAKALNLPFAHVNLTAGASETWLFGRQTLNGFVEGSFSKTYREGGVFLADEMDAADSNLMLSINTAIAGQSMYNPILGEQIKRHKDFVFVAAANTFGKGGSYQYTGRNRLDAATLDRFVVMEIDYDKNLERSLIGNEKLLNFWHDMREELKKLGSSEVLSTRSLISTDKRVQAGIDVNKCLDQLTAAWSEDAKIKSKAVRDTVFGGKKKALVKKDSTPKVDLDDNKWF